MQTIQDLMKADLSSLQNAIAPEFIFNALHNLYGLVLTKSEKAPFLLLRFSDLLSYVIYDAGKEAVSIQADTKMMNDLIELHRIRFDQNMADRISFELKVAHQHRVVPMLFVPLIERCLKYGSQHLDGGGMIQFSLNTFQDGFDFAIKISKGNIKYDPAWINQSLREIKERLDRVYQDHFEVRMDENGKNYFLKINIQL